MNPSPTPQIKSIPSNEPPLPHLSGPLPVPRPVKWARSALTLSLTGTVMFFAALFILIAVGGGRGIFPTINREITATVGGFLLVGSLLPSLTGLVIGILTRKMSTGKAALVTGSANLGLWLILLCAAMLFEAFH